MTRYRHLITDENRKWWTLGAMCFALFMIMLDNTVVNVALPSIQRDLGSSISGLEWTVKFTQAIQLDTELIDEFCLENEKSWQRMQTGEVPRSQGGRAN